MDIIEALNWRYATKKMTGEIVPDELINRITEAAWLPPSGIGQTVSSPFSIFAKVKDGKLIYLQFMEDTFATAASLQVGSVSRTYQNFPDSEPFTI